MIRKALTTVLFVFLLLWLAGWVLSVDPLTATKDVAHLATAVYGWVHASASSLKTAGKRSST